MDLDELGPRERATKERFPKGSNRNRLIRVMTVDDHPAVLRGLKSLLSEEFQVVGGASSGREAVSLAAERTPDVVLMDVRLPDINGLECMRRMRLTQPELKVVFLTASRSDLFLTEALRWGANGYLMKDAGQTLIADAIRWATQGGCLLTDSLVTKAFAAVASVGPETPGSADVYGLTPREMDVLSLIAVGQGNRAIAKQLHLAEVTIKKHVQSIYSKMGVNDRTQAALRAVRLGFNEADHTKSDGA